ncbi:MAG: class GN sortase [Rhizobiales bacterium]|nr:class GN sortase [Hyphomicrobiales bacterium]
MAATHSKTAKTAARGGAVVIACLIGFGLWQLGHGLYMEAKAHLAFHLLDRAWSETLIDGKPHKAWAWADAWPVAKIEVPRLRATEIVLSNASGEALAFAPGHVLGSPLPGESGTSVIAAHRDTHFSFLRDIAIGDVIIITTSDRQTYTYQVSETRISRFDQSRIDPTSGNRIALVTCYPFDEISRGPLRFIVEGHRINSLNTTAESVYKKQPNTT